HPSSSRICCVQGSASKHAARQRPPTTNTTHLRTEVPRPSAGAPPGSRGSVIGNFPCSNEGHPVPMLPPPPRPLQRPADRVMLPCACAAGGRELALRALWF